MPDDRRLPYMKWFVADVRRDTQLLTCSLATRAVWWLSITLMHEAEPYGHLLLNGKKPDEKELAQQFGTTPKAIRKAFAEIIEKNVCSLTAEGIIYSRRMVRDRAKFLEASDFGRKGKGNPALRVLPFDARDTDKGVSKATFKGASQPRGQRPDTRGQIPEKYSQGSVPRAPTAGPPVPKHIRPRVPPFIHEEFLSKLGDGDTPSDVIAFYERVTAEWKGRTIDDDDPTFWRSRWRERRGPAVKPTSKPAGRTLATDIDAGRQYLEQQRRAAP